MTSITRETWRNPVFLVGAAAALVLLAMVALSPTRYLYDEPAYLASVIMLVKGASFAEMLRAPLETPAGPLYAALQWVTYPLTHLRPGAVRWLNLVLLAVTIAANAYALSRWAKPQPWARALMLLGLPIMWVSAGMALTEMGAVAFASLSIACVAWAMTRSDEQIAQSWAGFAAAGLCFGICVLGRQPFLPAVSAFVLIAAVSPRFRWPAAAAAVIACLVPLPVFLLWGGLVNAHLAHISQGLNLDHGLRGYSYLSILLLILAPRYFLSRWRWTVGIGLLAGIAWALFGNDFGVAEGLMHRLPAAIAPLARFGATAVMVGGAACVGVASAINLWERRDDRLVVLAILMMLGLAATPAAVTVLFSSRYLMTAFPFALFAVQPFFVSSRWAAARLVGGALLGYLSLSGYYAVVGTLITITPP